MPADIFPRNSCHGGEIALRDLLPNEDAALPDVTAERVGKAQESTGSAPFHRQKVRGHQRLVRVAQSPRQQCRDMTIEVRP
jgi:hypothetical protein